MTMEPDPRSDVVAAQYERWTYPEPIADLPSWLIDNWQWFDPSHAHLVLWPDRGYQPHLRILVAGCGTNQAAVIAHTNPSAEVIGIDVSASSLAHHEGLKQRYGLRNLELHQLPIEEVGSLAREFDLIISTGVLHHLADPQTGIDALASCLSRDGVMALMLYGRYGRVGVDIMESVFRDMGLHQDEDSVTKVKAALDVLPPQHPVRGYLANADDTNFDAGLVDTFLHGRARTYTVTECLELVDNAGLEFQGWFFRSAYEPSPATGNDFLNAVRCLPDIERWSIMERINAHNACHFFLACRADRPHEQYRIDTNTESIGSLIPVFRYRCGLDGDEIIKPGWRARLSAVEYAIVSCIDGRRSIADIVSDTGAPVAERQEVEGLFLALQSGDFIELRIPG